MAEPEDSPVDASARASRTPLRVGAEVERVIEALFGIDAGDAARARDATRSRRRPRRQQGPSADYR